MDARKDYSATLGVLPTIDDAALTAVCRTLLKKHHPDVAEGDTTDGRAADIIDAYRVLGDAERRRKYDAARKAIARRKGKQDAPPAEGARRQLGVLRRLVTVFAFGFGLRMVISAGVVGFIAAPFGTRLADMLEPLAALASADASSAAGNVKSVSPFPASIAGGRNVVRHVAASDASASADIVRGSETPLVKLAVAAPHGPEIEAGSLQAARAPQRAGARFAGSSLFETLYGGGRRHGP
jgi:curved DNA-binding protein CbpA